jgi:mycothiol system anti-sigma-R factor
MTCQELDRLLYPYLDGEFQPEERMDVEAHLAECTECARQVEAEKQMREALRRAARHSVQSARAPASLRLGIEAGLKREQRRAQVGLWMRASAAALVVLTAGGAWMAFESNAQRQRFMAAAVRHHAKALPFEVASNNPKELEDYFRNKLNHPVVVPELPNATAKGARFSNVKDNDVAYVSYEAAPVKDGDPARRIGLFVFDDSGRDLPAKALPAVQVDSSDGYNVAVWREGEVVYELVSDLDEADIRKMVTQQHPQLASHPSRPVRPDVPAQNASLRP